MAAEDRDYFRSEYEEHLSTLFRRRFLFLSVACIAWEALAVGLGYLNRLWAGEALDALAADRWPTGTPRPEGDLIVGFQHMADLPLGMLIASGLTAAGVAAWFGLVRRSSVQDRSRLIREASLMILLVGLTDLLMTFTLAARGIPGSTPIASVIFWHFVACLFLPWSPWQSLRPILPLAAVALLGSLAIPPIRAALGLFEPSGGAVPWRAAAGSLLVLPIGLAPGFFLCWWRLRRQGNRFQTRRFREGFLSLRRELAAARALHESVFPEVDPDGPLPFRYAYRPANELGGDFTVTWVRPDDARMLILADVFGHGIQAALAVQRLSGEIERLRLEHPMAGPQEIMSRLHRYCELVLAPHQSFVTAFCAELDAGRGTLCFVSAGHPTAFLRHADGRLPTRLESNAPLLGIPAAAGHAPQWLALRTGDCLVAYTDGVIEARDPEGQQLGEANLLATVSSPMPASELPERIAAAVDGWCRGRRDDDVLVAMVGPVEGAGASEGALEREQESGEVLGVA